MKQLIQQYAGQAITGAAVVIFAWAGWVSTNIIGNASATAEVDGRVAVVSVKQSTDEQDIVQIKTLLQDTHDAVIQMAARQGISVRHLSTSTPE